MTNSYLKRILAGVMATSVLAASFSTGALATNSVIVSDKNPTVGSASKSLEDDDIIDTTLAARLTIHKYDLTAAEADGFTAGSIQSTGEQNADAESALNKYALEGVVFSYMRVGNIATYNAGGNVEVVYNIPASLMKVLSLFGTEANAATAGKATLSDGTSTVARYVDKDSNCYFNSQQLNSAMSDLLSANSGTDGKNALEKWAHDQTEVAADLIAMNATDDKGTSVADDLKAGLYIIIETSVPEEVNSTTNPFFVSLPMTNSAGDQWVTKTDENGKTFYDAHVYPKNQTNNPTIDKLVHEENDTSYADTTTISEGDTLDFRIASKLPTITSSSTYLTQYDFVDQMSKGLSYNGDFEIKIYENQEDAEQGTGTPLATWTLKDSGDPKFSVSVDGASSYATGSKATISLTEAGLNEINKNVNAEKTQYSDKYLVVTYTVKAESVEELTLGDSGNQNDVTLTYTRSNTNYSNTISDEAIVYSYGINLQKNFSDNDGDPTKVQFVLYNETHGYYVTAKQQESGLYYVTDGTKAAHQADATVFSPASGNNTLNAGALVINGLEADTYVLTEVHTDSGYILLRDPITIKITGTETTVLPNVAAVTGSESVQPTKPADVKVTTVASATVDDVDAAMSNYYAMSTKVTDTGSTNAMVDMNVLNTPGFQLPVTGGTGVLILTLAGIAGVTGAGIVLKKMHRKVED